MVNSNPYNAQGPIRGRKRFSYQPRPLARSPRWRDRYPASRGSPRKMSTDLAICQADTSMPVVLSPSHPGSTDR